MTQCSMVSFTGWTISTIRQLGLPLKPKQDSVGALLLTKFSSHKGRGGSGGGGKGTQSSSHHADELSVSRYRNTV